MRLATFPPAATWADPFKPLCVAANTASIGVPVAFCRAVKRPTRMFPRRVVKTEAGVDWSGGAIASHTGLGIIRAWLWQLLSSKSFGLAVLRRIS
jgi:hypothetical protein